ncbi:hypothetical protein EYF80_010515 [Liparis tanakae]|uniref:Uncharacterized protein n=1 Tax=Liparis tanakae TaxID=230148 RepID=A0A4Z2IMK3_9TELE|nr:hypothetical protein EYF80_010515 [Liparis tanakae]
MKPAEVTVRAPIPLEMRVAIVLYKLASCAEYRVVANQFGVHRSTVKKMVYQFCNGMVTLPAVEFIVSFDFRVMTREGRREECGGISRMRKVQFLVQFTVYAATRKTHERYSRGRLGIEAELRSPWQARLVSFPRIFRKMMTDDNG